MPEGPELLFWSIFLKKKFIKGKIQNMKFNITNDIVIPENFDGEIVDVLQKGKLLWFKVKSNGNNSHYYVHLHLGITGWIMFKDAKNVKYSFEIKLSNKIFNIYIEDKTKLSEMEILDEEEHIKSINKLGIDIFTEEFTIDNFKMEIKKKRMILASFLLKQEIFCGIGNYIKNEVLYMDNLDINCKTNILTDEQIENLYKNILFVAYSCLMEQLRNSKIENLLSNKNIMNKPEILEIPYEYKIYKRKLTDDGKRVKITKVGGRDTYYVEKI